MSLRDYLKIIGCEDWQHFLGFVVLGSVFSLNIETSFLNLFLGYLSSFLFLWCMHLTRSYLDLKIVKFKEVMKGTQVFVSRIISKRVSVFISAFLLIIALGTGFLVSIHFSLILFLLSILFIVYSLKLQYLFLSSTLAAVPIVVLLFLTGYSISSPIDACALVVALFCIPAGLSIQLLTEVYNLDFDSLIKRKTFTLIFGRQATNFLMYITVILSVIGAISAYHYSLFFTFIYTLFIGRFVLFPLFSSNLPKPLQNRTMIVVQRSPRLMRKLVRDSLTFFSLILAFLCFVFLLFIKLYVI